MKKLFVVYSLILVALLFAACVNGETVNDKPAEATFVVHWFDVGVNVLEGRSGVLSVERGWRGSSEINRVIYDPEKTDVQKIEKLLKRSGTYIRTVEEPQ